MIFYPTGTNKQRRHKEGSIHISLEDHYTCTSCEQSFSISRCGGLFSCEHTCDFNMCHGCKGKREAGLPAELSIPKPPIYEGDRSPENKEHGYGILRFQNGNQYEGEWQEGKRFGKGKYTQTDGFSYEGDWRNNFMFGEGNLTVPNEFNYVGTFEYGMMHGQGVQKAVDETYEYRGEFVQGRREGQGKYKDFAKEELYDGQF